MLYVLLILGVVALAVASPGFRALLVAVIGVVVILAIAFVGYLSYEQREYTQEREAARKRIAPGEVELVDLTLQPDYGSTYRLIGRLRNHSSRFALHRVELQVTLRDCDAAGACEIVGQATPAIAVIMPSGQARDLNEHVYFSDLGTPKGRYNWSYTIQAIEGE